MCLHLYYGLFHSCWQFQQKVCRKGNAAHQTNNEYITTLPLAKNRTGYPLMQTSLVGAFIVMMTWLCNAAISSFIIISHARITILMIYCTIFLQVEALHTSPYKREASWRQSTCLPLELGQDGRSGQRSN